MAQQNSDSNQLLRFMNTATTNIQEALGRPGKGKKVNHRKYIQKRLQPCKKCPRKTKAQLTTIPGRQPVATMLGSFQPSSSSSWATPTQQCTTPNEYDELFQLVSQPVPFSPPTLYNSRPTSAQEGFDPEIENLLSEFGLESPSQVSHYTDSSDSRKGSLVSLSSQVPESVMVTSHDYLPFSPHSDFSDLDDSPRNSSPVCIYSHNPSPSPPEYFYHQHITTASCEFLPTGSTSAVPVRPIGLDLPFTPSITEILELVSTP